jgi:hypothetical protein
MGINQETNDVSEPKMTFEEMAQIVDEVREIEFYEHQAKDRKWKAEQFTKVQVFIGLLRRHLPADVLPESEELLSTAYGCGCIYHLLMREQKRRALLEELAEAESDEIEEFVDTGVWRSKDELAKRRAALEARIRRGGDEVPF